MYFQRLPPPFWIVYSEKYKNKYGGLFSFGIFGELPLPDLYQRLADKMDFQIKDCATYEEALLFVKENVTRVYSELEMNNV